MSALAICRASRMQAAKVMSQRSLLGSLLRSQSLSSMNEYTNPAPRETQGSSLPSLLHFRSFMATPFAAAGLQVVVPPLGESITDAVVSTIFKKVGDTVEEDESILQLETDKVNIDVRSPKSGTIEAILVMEDENVLVGHVVASIAEGTSAVATKPASSSSSSPPPAASNPSSSSPPPPSQAELTESSHHHRVTAIHFPPRRTPNGDIISMMSTEDAAAAVAALTTTTTTTTTTPTTTSNDTLVAPTKPQRMTAPPQAPQLFVRVPSSRAGSLRKELTDLEIEQIMLGGASE